MQFPIIDGEEFISLTYEDEQSVAKAVMDCISLRWVSGEFQDMLNNIFYIKCSRGSMIRLNDLYVIIDFLEANNLGTIDLADNNKDIATDLSVSMYPTKELRYVEVRRTVIQAWREVWDAHKGIKAVADVYKRFPGDEYRTSIIDDNNRAAKFLEFRKAQEAKLDAEIKRMMDEWGCTYAEAFREASDWIPMPENLDDYDLHEEGPERGPEKHEPKWLGETYIDLDD